MLQVILFWRGVWNTWDSFCELFVCGLCMAASLSAVCGWQGVAACHQLPLPLPPGQLPALLLFDAEGHPPLPPRNLAHRRPWPSPCRSRHGAAEQYWQHGGGTGHHVHHSGPGELVLGVWLARIWRCGWCGLQACSQACCEVVNEKPHAAQPATHRCGCLARPLNLQDLPLAEGLPGG